MAYTRNPYLISKAMRKFLIASLLALAIQQLNITVDGIIVSYCIHPDAFSAINLFMPLNLAMTSIGTLFGAGATILTARYIGELQAEKANKALSTAVSSLMVAGVIIGISILCFKEEVISLICHQERLTGYFSSYMTVILSCSAIIMFSPLSCQMTSVDGHPEKVIRATIIAAFSNLVMDLLFVLGAGWGIAGSALATVLSTLLSIAYLWSYLLSARCSYRIRPISSSSLSCLNANMKQGLPLVISNLVLMLMFATINNIIQEKQGADGLFVLSICTNLLMMGFMLTNGLAMTMRSVGGFLNGQQDYTGLKILVNKGILLLSGSMAAFVLVIQLCPSLLTTLFGANTPELLEYSNTCLRLFSWLLPFIMLSVLMVYVYQTLGYLIAPPIIILSFPVTLIPSMMLWASLAGDDYVWYAFPETGVAVLLYTIVFSMILRRGRTNLHFFTLVPKTPTDNTLDISIKTDRKSMTESLGEVTRYLSHIKLGKKLSNDINLCVEEVIMNIAEHSGCASNNHFIDVYINVADHALIASVKDDGKAFDPVKCNERQMGMGLKILHSLCPDIEYKYMYGQNMTFMKWEINKTEKI